MQSCSHSNELYIIPVWYYYNIKVANTQFFVNFLLNFLKYFKTYTISLTAEGYYKDIKDNIIAL